MDGGGRAEAERWLYTANKLLTARDLHGARSFAIRARESDPRFDATELLLAVIDTLLAGEARISDHLLDWYSILQVLRYTQSIEYIAAQYRRLAILLDPHRNPFAFATHAFQLVHDAWSVLSNPNKKIVYDNDLRLLTEPPQQPPPPPAPAPVPPMVTGFQFSPPRQIQNQHHHNQNENQNQHYQNQHQSQQQQQQVQIRKNPKSVNQARVVVVEEETHNQNRSLDNVTEPEPVRVDRTGDSTQTQSVTENVIQSFWTACPYCYVMYEYPKVYEDCTLRCQNCRRGFTAAVVRAPLNLGENDDRYCSWGFIPLGFSGNFKDLSGGSSDWNPFSPLFPCPLKGGSTRKGRKGPVAYYDQEACVAFVEKELSDSSDDSDDGDWRNTYTKRLRKRARGIGRRTGFASASGVVRRLKTDRSKKGVRNNVGDVNVANGEAVNGHGGGPAPAVAVAARPESSKKAALVGARRRGAANLGKLDLNVEFSNEVDEHAPGASEGNGMNGNGNVPGTGNAEDNIEGIGFFEGLDEFLSSLPILNVVADDKVKGH
ncbi:hypothetical protein Lal_00044146 [Lupinus albus]|uniref:Putative DnaJ domain, WD40/YVTN repeat-like-containing domain-containing protein n=1 Tax=Lupinus albus TaxID=3870 RepID=A0A6A5PCP9_LUPAL|nr:putative DnaJ domain, WD40/YVTN repeat-like-containing domain-containing protein [Lupinus albus]KAF1895495.1 hypothetical protein Lal_00044146 [Lupinus albus]